MRRHTGSLIRLVRDELLSPKMGTEVGVWRGDTTVGLLDAFPSLIVVAVDAWGAVPWNLTMPPTMRHFPEADKRAFDDAVRHALDRVVVLQMESAEAARTVADWSQDFVFIDADHVYESVRRDLEAWWPKVRPGGLLCGHDYDGKGDRRGDFGVKRAVDEWAAGEGRMIGVRPWDVWWVKK